MKSFVIVSLVLLYALILAGPVFAQEAVPAGEVKKEEQPAGDSVKIWLAISIGFSLSLAVVAGAFGQSKAISSAVESMARQPEAASAIRGALIIGLALIETLVIYMLLISFFLFGILGKLIH
ncbi:MAG: ATP synthase F0 subunit C [Planctomycetes bacterium]|nr:ATP synthase F0 subunit C [Planctomycetota bacterium]